MNIGDIKQAMEDFLQVDTIDLSPNGVDLSYLALNNVRKHGERKHDFNATQCSVVVPVDPTLGGSLKYCQLVDGGVSRADTASLGVAVAVAGDVVVLTSSDSTPWGGIDIRGYDTVVVSGLVGVNGTYKILALVGEASFVVQLAAAAASSTGSATVVLKQTISDHVNLKSIQKCYISGRPVRFMPKSHWMMAKLEKRERELDAWDHRYAGDEEDGLYVASTRVLIHGERIFLEPVPDEETNIYIDGYRWLPDYTTTTQTDMFTEYGHDYLLWGGVVELNHLVKTFVPRQEGNLNPPVAMMEKAWESLVAWDDYQNLSGSNYSLSI